MEAPGCRTNLLLRDLGEHLHRTLAMKANLDRFSEPMPWENEADADRQQEIEAERADRWHDQAVDREADERKSE